MRGGRPLAAAALAALALAAGACKPSSLTPFGIGTRSYDTAGLEFNGAWEGTNSTGLEANFQVGSNEVSNLFLRHQQGSCVVTFDSDAYTALVEDGAFSLEVLYTQGRIVVNGRFSSSTTSTGDYTFEAISAAAGCPTSGSGTFASNKVR